jgi:hypothetical protein
MSPFEPREAYLLVAGCVVASGGEGDEFIRRAAPAGRVSPAVRETTIARRHLMGTAVSLLMIAAGAIMVWAVNATVSGLSIHTVGVILMVVGAVGLVLSIIFWSSWGGFSGAGAQREGSSTTVVER